MMMNEFENSIIDLEVERAVDMCREIVFQKVSVDEIFRAIARALDVVGQRYEEGRYFLSELIMAGEVVKEVLKVVEPLYKKDARKTVATVVLATVKGDLHDVGKNILSMLLQSSGFKVIDLGVDVPTEDVVKAAEENNADIVGLSALLTTVIAQFGNVVEELKKRGIRDKVKVIIGGSAVNGEVARDFKVDSWGKIAVDGLRTCEQWISQRGG